MTQLFIYLEMSWFLFHFWGIILVNIELLVDIYIFSAFEYIGLLPSGLIVYNEKSVVDLIEDCL